jgi:hypothetical protein
MRKFAYLALIAVIILMTGCASGESFRRANYDFSQVGKVAVLDVTGEVRGEGAKNQIADYFAMELLRKGYSPIERKQVEAILKEQEMQASAITREGGAAKAGRILNVPAVIVVNVPEFRDDISMTAKMLDVEDGSILWAASGSGSTGGSLPAVAGAVVGAGVGILAGGDTAGKVAGGVAGGALGGIAGHALTPRQAETVRSIIRDMTEDMPSATSK